MSSGASIGISLRGSVKHSVACEACEITSRDSDGHSFISGDFSKEAAIGWRDLVSLSAPLQYQSLAHHSVPLHDQLGEGDDAPVSRPIWHAWDD